MNLGSLNTQTNHYDVIRELTPDELSKHTEFTPVCVEARNRLTLFRLLDRNYQDWKAYLRKLLSAEFREDGDISDELNRLLLNYLTFAYSIQEHFEVSFRQRFKKDATKLKEYEDFLNRVCSASWPFAFILDFRGYVQHVGLGIGRNNRNVNDDSVTIEITADAKQLVADSRQWKRSALTEAKGEIELIPVIKEFHIQMIQSYAVYVAKVFFPELKDAAEFYQTLTVEAKAKDPLSRMVFFDGTPKVEEKEGGKKSINLNLAFVPNDLFQELGIKITKA